MGELIKKEWRLVVLVAVILVGGGVAAYFGSASRNLSVLGFDFKEASTWAN